MEEMDAIDNGVPMYADAHPRYRINTHLSSRVHRLNPEWNSPIQDSDNLIFEKAMALVGSEFTEAVINVSIHNLYGFVKILFVVICENVYLLPLCLLS